jgi:hypothetical protein
MDLAKKQEYNAWLKKVGDLALEWSRARPDNKDLKALVTGISRMGVIANELMKENIELTVSKDKTIEEFKDITRLMHEKLIK